MPEREIVLDTETTGFDPSEGHRVVEIACIELINLMPSGQERHYHFNPDRDMPPEALAVHGLTEAFLAGKPRFHEHVDELLAFFGDAPLVAHNAQFDLGFIQAELKLCNRPPVTCKVVDTLQISRTKYPGSPASLDALCRRFNIDLSERAMHGALIDTRLLAKVYLELMGGKEPGLSLTVQNDLARSIEIKRIFREPRAHAPSEAELLAHSAHVASLKEALWLQAG